MIPGVNGLHRATNSALVPEIQGALAFAAAALRGLDISDEHIAREIAVQCNEMELDTDQTSAATAAP
jgi:hypothetical protein